MRACPRGARALGASALALLLAGCATSSPFRAGERAEHREDFDQAVIEYSKAVKSSPGDLHFKKSLERARLRASEAHAAAGRRLASRGLYKEAIEELRLARELNPQSSSITSELSDVEARLRASIPPSTMEEMKQRTRERALPGLALGPGGQEPLGVSFRNVSLREAYLALGKAAGVNFIFDPQLIDDKISIDLRDVPFEQALTALANVGRTFYRVTDSKVITVIPDNPTKRRDYEQQVVKTFFLSNADLRDTIDLLRVVLGARRVAPLPGANAFTINDTPERVAAAERIVNVVDKKRSEVVVEVEILEVNRSRLKEYGIEITSGVKDVEGIVGAVFPGTTVLEEEKDAAGKPVRDFQGKVIRTPRPLALGDNPYTTSNLLVSSLPGLVYRLLKKDGDTRVLANPQLRITEGQAAEARFGDQVPVPVTIFTPVAQGGLAQQPVTSFEYKNIGVNIDITPRVHHDGDISLTLKLEISSVGAAGFQGLPSFNTRTVKSVIRLREGETNMLAGLMNDTERTSLTGLPGLASVPILGRLFSRSRSETVQTDIVMTLTPYIVQRPQITEEDLRSFQVGSDTAPLLFEPPTIPTPGTPARPPDAPRVQPIRPPTQPTPPPGTEP